MFSWRWAHQVVFLAAGAPPGARGPTSTGADRTITLDEDSTYEFKVTDYGFADAGDVPPDAFTRLKLTTLPEAGTLLLDGRAVAQNDFISVTPGSGIVWTPRESNRSWQSMAVSANGMTMAALGFGSLHLCLRERRGFLDGPRRLG